jgi:tRNA threonylcarbamoyladenosine biosynthesis protein TsaB
MNLLALETSSSMCSVALRCNDDIRMVSRTGQKHSSFILPMIDRLLAEAGLTTLQLDGLAFGCGPGSFTGLRIGAGVAQGIAYGADLPVAAVSSLAALAQGVEAGCIVPAVDARMGQIYFATYRRNKDGRVELENEEQLVDPHKIIPPATGQWTGTGSGWDRYAQILEARFRKQLSDWKPAQYPLASNVTVLALEIYEMDKAVKAEDVSPVYLREKVARKMNE